MKRIQMIPKWVAMLLGVGFVLAIAASAMAQVETQTTTSTSGPATKHVSVEKGEIVFVGDHELVVKMANGELRHITNIPDNATAMVDGQPLTIKDAKVGMKLEKTITTTTTPRMITTVQTVTGTVFNVIPPKSVTLTMEDGKNQTFKIPEGQKFNIDGQMVDAFGLKPGMKITATKVTETPETVVTQKKLISGELPPPPPPPQDAALLVVYVPVPVSKPTPAPAPAAAPAEAAEAAPAALPKTASYLPLIGLLGVVMLSAGLALRAVEKVR